MNIEFIDNSDKVKEEFEKACLKALEECGMIAEGYAKELAPVDTGNLRNSISHTVDDSGYSAYIGSNISYAAFQELGTVKMKAHPFLKPAIANHESTYRGIIEDELKNG